MDQEKSSQTSSCMDDYDPQSLSIDDAIKRIQSAVTPIAEHEAVSIKDALNRVLAEPVHSFINVPPYTNSAMDGYAVRSSDIPLSGEKQLKLAGTVMAGKPIAQRINAGECARILTGAKMPDGADTVIMQEHVTITGTHITIGNRHRAGQNVRHTGEDIAQGQMVLTKGRRLTAADVGLLASLGVTTVNVVRMARVAFFSTGDELVALGTPLKDGQIYDSNRYALTAMLQRFGANIIDLGAVKDNRRDIEETFNTAARQADVVITSGGVSVGDADYVRETMEKLGRINFWKIAMKPGRPLAFGKIDHCLIFGLPGNPVSTMVTFYQFVLPALRKLQGESATEFMTLQLPCVTPLRKTAGRVEFQRGVMEKNRAGEWTVKSVGGQGSHLLSSMSKANCFIILPMECENVEPGTVVTVQPFCGLI
ncbi:MAG: molybdopterin molybdotransferase MoeA [Gammaproteobacteria bacterium]|nr:molybdopterin molybdotransferase MoeA [Gammaproteobacteria bacterium]